MKKAILTASLILCLVTLVQAQALNTEMDLETDSPFLLGEFNKNGLTSENYKSWFSENYDTYELDANTIKAMQTNLKDYTILAFMGTWCGDSKLEVPRFYKVLEACNYPINQLKFVAVSRKADMYKQSPNHEEKGLNIHRVPTFIFYKDGIEVNRIVEHPVESFEKDILTIISSNNYKSQYYAVTKVDDLLKKGKFKASKKIAMSLKPDVKKLFELNTYAHILFTTDRPTDAIKVLKLNIMLFPEESKSYENLANKYYALNDTKKALKQYQKALKLDSENEILKETITSLKK